MKKIFLLGMVAGLLASCQSKTDGYTIEGTLTGDAASGKAYLERSVYLSDPVVVDSTMVQNGSFTFSGKVERPGLYYVIIDLNKPGEEPDYHNKMFRTMLYLENSDITYKGDVATLPGVYYAPERENKSPEITGSSVHDLFVTMNKEIQVYSDTLNTLMERYADEYLVPESEGKDVSAVGMEIAREEMKWKDKLLQYQLDFIKKHADSPVAMDQAMYYLSGMEFLPDVKEIDQMQALFEKHWAGTAELEHFTTAASAARPLAVGQKYKDIDVLDRNGKTVKLSSMIPENEYVMLEFWASWCGPCRGEIPHLRKIHDKYKDFAIVSISLDEKDSEWQKAMKEENMSWTQGRIEGGIYGAGAKEYNIQAIPMCLILDKEGRFYKTNMRGAYLDVFLDDLYKAN